ncbi:SIR2 family protein [Azospirillum sp. SYSU D00513]|uniref:SIR2 family protein n=1 Tax=Azospirillum sp. SYSU D00513 TaxID=2812561 RepID=UPI001A96395C|nr:SIR2 family protein [Azospirillum sp. SYSU D00513]
MSALCPPDLRRLYHDDRVIPFIGAGASMAVTWMRKGEQARGPSWRQLVDHACEILGINEPELLRVRGSDLQILEYFRAIKGGFAPLTNWLSAEFSYAEDSDILRCPIHQALVRLERCRIFYTTNYDNFIERALRASKRETHVTSSELNINHKRFVDEVVKFHGDFNDPENMVFSESQYFMRMRFENAMDFKLRSDILGRAVLFIGYSFNDTNVNYLFHLVNHIFNNLPNTYTGRRAYIALPDPSEFERRLFHMRNIEVIPIPSASPEKAIADLLDDMRV